MRHNFLRFFLCCFAIVWAVSSGQAAAYDKPYIGETIEYRAKFEDTFVYLARDYNLGYVEMRAANPDVDPWVPGERTKLILPTRHILPDTPREGIVINLPEMRLYAYVNGDEAPSSYSIGIGREGLDTPIGATKVVRKQAGPTWRPTPRMRREDPELPEVVEPGPENPLGTHALYLGWPTYAIHGTNRPFGIGRRISSGCIRLYPEGIETLFEQVPVGTPVRVVNQPIKVAWIDDRLYLEAHPELEQAIQMEETGEIAKHSLSDEAMEAIISIAGAYEDRLRWPAIRTAIRERRGYPIEIARRPFGSVQGRTAGTISTGNPSEAQAEEKKIKNDIDDMRDVKHEKADKSEEPAAIPDEEPQQDGQTAAYDDGQEHWSFNN